MIELPIVPEGIADVCFLAGVKVCHHKSWLHGTNFSDGWAQQTKDTALDLVKDLQSGGISIDYLRCSLGHNATSIRDDMQSVDIAELKSCLIDHRRIFESIGYLALSEMLIDDSLKEKLGNKNYFTARVIEIFRDSLNLNNQG